MNPRQWTADDRAPRWQPITTAPRDGSWVVVWSRRHGLTAVRYRRGWWTEAGDRVTDASEWSPE